MKADLVDLSFLYEIADNDPVYIHDVLGIFLETVPPGIDKLEKLVRETEDWEAIYKQAHFLKSSVSVVKIRGMFEGFNQIEILARPPATPNKDEVTLLLDEVLQIFAEARPYIQEKYDS